MENIYGNIRNNMETYGRIWKNIWTKWTHVKSKYGINMEKHDKTWKPMEKHGKHVEHREKKYQHLIYLGSQADDQWHMDVEH